MLLWYGQHIGMLGGVLVGYLVEVKCEEARTNINAGDHYDDDSDTLGVLRRW